MKNEEAFSVGVIPGLKSIILNKYGIPIERKENVYTYSKEINSFINELNKENHKDGDVEENAQKKKIELDYELTKKNIVNQIKEINNDKKEYLNFINNNYNEADLYGYGNRNNMNNMMNNYNNYNKYYNDFNLKKEDLTPGEITQLDFLFNKYIK